tara:strand:- start:2738 stop:3625 length:888 start_codon:yes stop_codon:yes gene_type:complete
MITPEFIGLIFLLPIIGVISYISINNELSINPILTWSVFLLAIAFIYVAAEFNEIIQHIIIIDNEILDDYITTFLCALNEEIYKLIILLAFLHVFRDKINLKRALFLGIISGLGFAIEENYYYSTVVVPNMFLAQYPDYAQYAYEWSLQNSIIRLVLCAPLHLMTTSITALFAYRTFVQNRGFSNIIVGTSIATAIHLHYNFAQSFSFSEITGPAMVVLGFFILQVLYKNFQNDEPVARKSTSFYKTVDRKSTVSEDILGSFKVIKKTASVSRTYRHEDKSREDESDEFRIIKKK